MRVTSTGLIGLLLATGVIFVVLLMAFERFFYATKNKTLIRMIVMAVALNVCIFLFLIFSFSKVQLEPGPVGPAGTRGRNGPLGAAAKVQGCDKVTLTLQKTKHQKDRKDTIVVEKPILGD